MRFDITPESLGRFIHGLLDQLRDHLVDADDVNDRQTIINEARQYLRGANALCASAAIGEWPQQDDYCGADGIAGLFEHMFQEAHARMDEIADETLSIFTWNNHTAEGLHKNSGH